MIVVVHKVLTRCYVQRSTPIFYACLSSAVSCFPLFPTKGGGFLLADEMARASATADSSSILSVKLRIEGDSECLILSYLKKKKASYI